jgi:hypothetical protein
VGAAGEPADAPRPTRECLALDRNWCKQYVYIFKIRGRPLDRGRYTGRRTDSTERSLETGRHHTTHPAKRPARHKTKPEKKPQNKGQPEEGARPTAAQQQGHTPATKRPNQGPRAPNQMEASTGDPAGPPAESGAHRPLSARREPNPPGHANTGPARGGHPTPPAAGQHHRTGRGRKAGSTRETGENPKESSPATHAARAGRERANTSWPEPHQQRAKGRQGDEGAHATQPPRPPPPPDPARRALHRGGRGPVDHQSAPILAHQWMPAWPRRSRGNPGRGRGR